MFSKSCEYAIKALVYIAQQSKNSKRVNVQDVAHHIDSPISFTAKTLQSLTHSGILVSIKGKYGGYELSPDHLAALNLLDIVHQIDGDKIYSACLLGFDTCDEKNPCPLHYTFLTIREEVYKTLRETRILDLVDLLDQGEVQLKISKLKSIKP